MTLIKKAFTITFCILAGTLITALFNYLFVERLLIPDPCYYHSNPTNWFFDIFYVLKAEEGYHPFPTMYNFIITVMLGAALGLIYGLALINNPKSKIHGTVS